MQEEKPRVFYRSAGLQLQPSGYDYDIAQAENERTLKACGLGQETAAETAVAGGEGDMDEREEEHSVVGLDFC